MRHYGRLLILLVVVCAAGIPATAQDRPATLAEKQAAVQQALDGYFRNHIGRDIRVARCPECADLAAQIIRLDEQSWDLWDQIFALGSEEMQLAQELASTDAAFQQATRNGDAAAAAKARTRLNEIVQQRLENAQRRDALGKQHADVLLEKYKKLEELEKCEAACVKPAEQGGGSGPGTGIAAPDLRVIPIPNSPGAWCKACQSIADLIAGTEAARNQASDYLARLRKEVKTLDQEIQKLAREGATSAWRSAGAKAVAMEREYDRVSSIHRELNGAIRKLHAGLRGCNLNMCRTGTSTDPPPIGGGAGTTGTATGGGSATCSACDGLPESIEKLEAELSDLHERIDGLERNISDVETLKAGATGNRVQTLDDQLKLMKERHQEAVQQQSQKSKSLEELKKKLEDCSKCDAQPKETSQLFRGPLPYVVGGGVAVGALLASGGGETPAPTAISVPTVTTPPTSTNPQPPTTPTNPTPTAPADFSLTTALAWEHISSNQSVVCGAIVTSPAQPGAPFSVQITGVGVISAQSTATGTLNSSGRGTFRLPILLLGTYNVAGSVISNSVTKPFSGSVNVAASSNSCP